MAPPSFSADDAALRREYKLLATLKDRMSYFAGFLAVVAVAIGVTIAATATHPAKCVVPATRYFEVKPHHSHTNDNKNIGSVRLTVQALQLAFGLELTTIDDTFTPSDGQWWTTQHSERWLLDTDSGALSSANSALVMEGIGNVTRLVVLGDPSCSTHKRKLEPTVSTDSDSFDVFHRVWRRSGTHVQTVNHGNGITVSRVKQTNSFRFKTLRHAGRVFPLERAGIHVSDARLHATDPVVLHVAAFVSGGIVAKLHVLCSRKGDPLENPNIVENILVTFDAVVAQHDRTQDAHMRHLSHRVQDLLGKAVQERSENIPVHLAALAAR